MTLDGGILGAEWRSVSRRHRIFSMRCGAVLVLAVLAWAIWPRPSAVFTTADFPERGRMLFLALYYVTYAILAVCAPVLMGSAIAREKEHRTLELLLLTPLGSGQIVLGKFISQFGALCLVPFSALPLVVACLFLGGVSTGEIVAGGFCLACLGLSVGAVAMLCSVFFSRTTVAVAVTYLALFFWSTAVFWGGMFAGPASIVFLLLNPFLILLTYPIAVVSPGFAPWMLPAAIGSTAVLSAICLALSAHFLRKRGLPDLPTWGATRAGLVAFKGPVPPPVPRRYGETVRVALAPPAGAGVLSGAGQAGTLAPRGGGVPSAAGQAGTPAPRGGGVSSEAVARPGPVSPAPVPFAELVETPARAQPPQPLPASLSAPAAPDIRTRPYRGPVWDDPVAWREIRIGPPAGLRVVQFIAVIGVAILAGFGLLFGIAGLASQPVIGEGVRTFIQGLLMFLQFPVFSACWLVLGLFAAQTVVGERKSGVLDTIQVTPVTPHDYLRGKVLGCLHATRWLIGLWAVLLGLMAMVGLRAAPFVLAWGACAIAFLMAVLALGLWASSRTDSPIAALTTVLAAVALFEGLGPGMLALMTDNAPGPMTPVWSLNVYAQAGRLLAGSVEAIENGSISPLQELAPGRVILFVAAHLLAAGLFGWRAAAHYRLEPAEDPKKALR
ncbi:MAG: ABC transporter permease [Planctomycetes bacterium]|nr:ABC transporter permease [Planctomycetota bacterium]